jgi:hypothetical protein
LHEPPTPAKTKYHWHHHGASTNQTKSNIRSHISWFLVCKLLQ